MKCCPQAPSREVPRDVHEYARDLTRRLMRTKAFLKSRNQRKRIEMRFAHLKVHHRFERMRLRGLSGARDEFVLAATVQNLKTLVLRTLKPSLLSRTCHLPETAKLVSVASASTSPAIECFKKPSNSITPTENLLFQQNRPEAALHRYKLPPCERFIRSPHRRPRVGSWSKSDHAWTMQPSRILTRRRLGEF